jgi:hypothetical protein
MEDDDDLNAEAEVAADASELGRRPYQMRLGQDGETAAVAMAIAVALLATNSRDVTGGINEIADRAHRFVAIAGNTLQGGLDKAPEY